MLMFHFYRNSKAIKRLLYKGGVESTDVDYTQFETIKGKDGTELDAVEEYKKGDEYLDDNVFSDLKGGLETLVNEIDRLEHEPGEDSEFEQKIKADLSQKFTEEMTLLEHNYSKVTVEALGNSDERLTMVQALLKSEFQEFAYQLQMEIYREAIGQDEKKDVTPEDEEGARAAKIMLINDAIGLDMGEYILDTNSASVIDNVFRNPLPSNPKEFNKRLGEELGEDELENAAERMLDEIDSNQTDAQIQKNEKYFEDAIQQSTKNNSDPKDRINFEIGDDESDRLVNVLARRFKYVEGKNGKKGYVIDLLPSADRKPSGRVKVKNDKDFKIYDADDFITGESGKIWLKNICDDKFRSTKDLKHQGKAIKKRNKKDKKMKRELLENIFRGKWSRLDEIRGLKQLRKRRGDRDFKNKTWEQVFNDAEELKTETNAFLNPEIVVDKPDDNEAQQALSPKQTAAKNARDGLKKYEGLEGFGDLLASIGALIDSLSTKNGPTHYTSGTMELKEIDQALDREGENGGPENIPKKRGEAKKAYAEVLDNKQPPATLTELMGEMTGAESILFDLPQPPEGADSEILSKFQAAKDYPSQKYEAMKEYITKNGGLSEGMEVTSADDRGITIKKDGHELTLLELKPLEQGGFHYTIKNETGKDWSVADPELTKDKTLENLGGAIDWGIENYSKSNQQDPNEDLEK